MSTIELNHKTTVLFNPTAPYNFDANFNKPSHFPSSDNDWKEDRYWITMLWQGRELGFKFENKGTTDSPAIKADIYSFGTLSQGYRDELVPEIRWRFNMDADISEFCNRYKKDKRLGFIIDKWRGMRPVAANSLYETLIIYIVLQNATVRRSANMLESLFNNYGNKVVYDDQTLSVFWKPAKIAASSEQALRDLKTGYRAQSIYRLSEQFASGKIDEFALRKASSEEIRREMLKLYGIGPASLEYLLFEDFYFCDKLETIPPWERKIMSRLLFDKESASEEEILDLFKKYQGWEKLAFHYLWEDIFWRRKHEHIEWLEKEIRL
jgi:3-methyladenine DNA glycosylase/8-oxoguanine DNA glycosylase